MIHLIVNFILHCIYLYFQYFKSIKILLQKNPFESSSTIYFYLLLYTFQIKELKKYTRWIFKIHNSYLLNKMLQMFFFIFFNSVSLGGGFITSIVARVCRNILNITKSKSHFSYITPKLWWERTSNKDIFNQSWVTKRLI